jgi:hypothetical protein
MSDVNQVTGAAPGPLVRLLTIGAVIGVVLLGASLVVDVAGLNDPEGLSLPTGVPTQLPTGFPTNLPTQLPTGFPTNLPQLPAVPGDAP